MAQAPARRRTFLGRTRSDEGDDATTGLGSDPGIPLAPPEQAPEAAILGLPGRLVFGRAQAALAGLAHCTPTWAAQSLRITAEQLGLSPEVVATYFLNQSESTPNADGDAVVVHLLFTARGGQGADRTPDEASDFERARRRHAEEIATVLQASLLPRALPAIAGISIAARYHVANREQVGGDFYDVIPTSAGCAVVVGDVSGKGAAAATLTGAARWTLRSHLIDAWTPASALTRLNQVLTDAYDDPETYCTVALAQLRLRKSGGADLSVALGGHPQPLLLRRDGHIEGVGTTDPALGWVAGSQYSQTSASIEPGESMVIFSDGLIEALLHNGVDDHRVHALLSNQHRASAEHIAGILDRHLTGRLRDDAAFVVVRLD